MVKFRIVLLVTAFGSAVFGHGSATGIVKERMDAMLDIAAQMKSLSAHFKGSAPLSAEEIKASAERVAGHSGPALVALFPEGSVMIPSEAKATIWSNPEGFQKLAKDMQMAAQSLGTAPESEQKIAFERLSATCRDCHKTYRIEKK